MRCRYCSYSVLSSLKTDPRPAAWALPGGFVNVDLDPDLLALARRNLQEKTGVTSPYPEQLGGWGSATRDPRGWSATHAYFALIPSEGVVLVKGANAADVAWFEVDRLLQGTVVLAFDHGEILRAAVGRLRGKAEYTSLPAFLLDEVVLGRPVDKSGFRTRDDVGRLPRGSRPRRGIVPLAEQ